MERKVYVPPSYGKSTVEIRTPLMNDLIQRLAGALSVNLPQIKVPPRPRGDQAKAQRNSSLLEKWTTAWLSEMEHQENDRLFYRFMDYLCGDGTAILKLVHRKEFWDDYPEMDDEEREGLTETEAKDYDDKVFNYKTSARLPFSLKVPDPVTVLPHWGDDGLTDVIEFTKRPKVFVAKAFDLVGDGKGGLAPRVGRGVDTGSDLAGDIEYWEHWTDNDVAYFVDRKCVRIIQHNYGRVPYFIALGTQTSSRDPSKEGLSVAHQLIHLIPALDSLLTMKTNSGFMQAYPAFKRVRPLGAPMRNDNDSDDTDESDEQFEPGMIYDGFPGEDLEAIQIPPVGQDVNQAIDIILGLVTKVGVPSVMEGNHSPNRVSGYAYSEMLNVSRTKYTTIIRNAAFAWEQTIRHLWSLIENQVREDVPVWGMGKDKEDWLPLGPDDIDNYYNIKVIIEPLLPEDDIATGQHAAAMVQAGMWSKRFAREVKMGISSPEEMEDEILVENAMQLPQVQMYILMKALERAEMDELKELFQMTTQMVEANLKQTVDQFKQNGTQPGQPGVPNLNPGTGGGGQPGMAPNAGAAMPGAGGILSGGQPKVP